MTKVSATIFVLLITVCNVLLTCVARGRLEREKERGEERGEQRGEETYKSRFAALVRQMVRRKADMH